MPEGPSIVILKEELSGFIGKKVISVSGNAVIELERLKGKKIRDMKSWGKHFLIIFDDFYIRIHLLMFGRYLINERKEVVPRLSLNFGKAQEVNFYTCSVKMFDGNVEDDYDWQVDTMSDQWKPLKAFKAVRSRDKEMICDTLLDQDVFAGSGNIIKNEVLFLSKVHPETKNNKIPDKKLKEIIKTTRDYCFRFYEWKKNYVLKKNYRIYTKKDCTLCNRKVKLKHTGKRKRRSFFCTHCQKKY
jgi:endonuclease-8